MTVQELIDYFADKDRGATVRLLVKGEQGSMLQSMSENDIMPTYSGDFVVEVEAW